MSETWELSLLLIERHDIIFRPRVTEEIFIAVAKKRRLPIMCDVSDRAASNNVILVC